MLVPWATKTIIWRLQVQSSLQASNIQEYLTLVPGHGKQSEQAAPVVSIKDVVRSSVKVPEFDKHLKKARGHIGRNVVEITIKMKTIVRKTLMIKIGQIFIFQDFQTIAIISVDMSGLLQVFQVEFESLHRTLNHVLYSIHRIHLLWSC